MNKQYITGFGQISHLGLNCDEALTRLQSPSETDILKVPKNHLNEKKFYGKPLEIEGLDLIKSPAHCEYHRANKIMTICVNEALEKAQIKPDFLKTQRVGVCIGTTSANLTCDTSFTQQYHRQEVNDFSPLTESFSNSLPSALAQYYSLKGPLTSINNACTSGTDVIGIARSWIKQGLCDVVIAGGIDFILEDIYFGFRSLGLVASESAKPFDKNREGLVLGEATGVVIVESDRSIQLRNGAPLCEVLGYGGSTDSFHPTSPHPEALGLSLAVDQALSSANMKKDQVDLINAHGTGTPTNDQVEGSYLVKNFPNTPVFATKAYTGHSLGAAGTLEAIWGIFCMNHNFIPATLGHADTDSDIGLTPNLKVRDYKAETYLSTSLGFGGSNAALLLGKVQ